MGLLLAAALMRIVGGDLGGNYFSGAPAAMVIDWGALMVFAMAAVLMGLASAWLPLSQINWRRPMALLRAGQAETLVLSMPTLKWSLLCTALAIALLFSGNKSDYKVLFAGVSDKDGGAIIAQLNQMNVPYRHSDGGSAILVPASQVHDVRKRLGTLGLPKANTGGYELLDTPKFGQTQAGENVAIKRALEGELTRTIASLNAVQNARVMLAIPATSGFFREQQKPSASVVVNLHPGRTLDASQLAGIVHLVSASVPELSPKAVSVVDGNGTLLTEQDGSTPCGLDRQQLQYRQLVEATMQRRKPAARLAASSSPTTFCILGLL
jgi:flagellar basal-body M-ring protein/flagellar hook-basal body protein fliF